MKISNEQAQNSLEYLRQTPPPPEPIRAESMPSDDEVETVINSWDGNDEVREAMVAEIQKEVSTESYEVPTNWVAEKWVGRLLSDRIR